MDQLHGRILVWTLLTIRSSFAIRMSVRRRLGCQMSVQQVRPRPTGTFRDRTSHHPRRYPIGGRAVNHRASAGCPAVLLRYIGHESKDRYQVPSRTPAYVGTETTMAPEESG